MATPGSSPTHLLKRVYEPRWLDDGLRVLVDRLWPRGLSRADADIDCWAKQLAPSTELRRWYGHREDRRREFRSRYLEELAALDEGSFSQLSAPGVACVTLLTATRDPALSHAGVLREFLQKRRTTR